MQISDEITSSDKSQSVDSLSPTQEKSPCDINSDSFRDKCEEVQRAKKTLANFLEPTIIAVKNGVISKKTAEEIVKETREKITREKLNGI